MRRVCPGTAARPCGQITSLPGGRCAVHRNARNTRRRDPFYVSREWLKLRGHILAEHVGRFGYVCPGDGPEHPAHPSVDLTADHVLARDVGGAPLDRSNLRVLCRSWNSVLGARLINAKRKAAVA